MNGIIIAIGDYVGDINATGTVIPVLPNPLITENEVDFIVAENGVDSIITEN